MISTTAITQTNPDLVLADIRRQVGDDDFVGRLSVGRRSTGSLGTICTRGGTRTCRGAVRGSEDLSLRRLAARRRAAGGLGAGGDDLRGKHTVNNVALAGSTGVAQRVSRLTSSRVLSMLS